MKNLIRNCITFSIAIVAAKHAFAGPEQDVVKHYTKIAHAVYEDSLITAKKMRDEVNLFIQSPSEKTLNSAKKAWKAARVPYSQSEVFRFGNKNVDLWEGKVNAWPLDEGLIDYVAEGYQHEIGNIGSTANLIANNVTFSMDDKVVNTSKITFELLVQLHEYGSSEANVTTGYHAIEFLLWGQDLNKTKSGAGQRPFTDFVAGEKCTNGYCARRVEYLQAAVNLLIIDLEDMVEQWSPDNTTNYTATLMSLTPKESLTRIFYGMGSLALGELAGERMKVALEANSSEDEQDCFSDNTHFSHFYNAKGIKNIYLGSYQRVDGSRLKGPGLSSLVAGKNKSIDKKLKKQLTKTEKKLQYMVDTAENKTQAMKFDQMIASGNKKGESIIQNVIDSLVSETELIKSAAASIGITNLNPDTASFTY